MKEQFVPYDIANTLIDKGFKEDCLGYYEGRDNNLICRQVSFYELEKYNLGILAPLWQQCLEWLEREHWVDFWAVPILTPNPKQYECFIMYRGKEISCDILGIRFFNSYNDARQTAVEKILKHI